MEKCFVEQDRIFLPDPGMFRQEGKMTASCRGKIPLLVQINKQLNHSAKGLLYYPVSYGQKLKEKSLV